MFTVEADPVLVEARLLGGQVDCPVCSGVPARSRVPLRGVGDQPGPAGDRGPGRVFGRAAMRGEPFRSGSLASRPMSMSAGIVTSTGTSQVMRSVRAPALVQGPVVALG